MMFHFYIKDMFPSDIVFGGDMNVDLSRTSPNSRILADSLLT